LDYYRCKVVIEGGVRTEGDYHGDSTACLSITSGASSACSPSPAQNPPSPTAPGAPMMPDSPGEVHVVIDLLDTPEIVVVSSEDEGHQEEEDDPEEDQDIDEAWVEQ